MIQKSTWINYLIIISTSTMVSCTEPLVDCIVESNFRYVNGTLDSLKTSLGDIAPQDTLAIYKEGLAGGGCNITEKDYEPLFDLDVISYHKEECIRFLGYRSGQGDGPLSIENYEYEKIEDNYYQFTYTFTEENLKLGVNCEDFEELWNEGFLIYNAE